MPFHTGQRIGAVRIVAVLVVLFAPALVRGQATAPAVGSRVLIKPGAVLKVGDRVVHTGKAEHPYTVERADGDWLWLSSGSIGGWAKASDLITLDRATELYSATIKKDPKAAWAYYNRGHLRHDRRDYDRAIADYDEAIRLDPEYVLALVNRGNAWEAKGDYDRAIADYDEAIRLDPKNMLAFLNRGIAWQAKGDYDKAIADYDEAFRRGLITPQMHNNRGHAWEMKKDYDKAIADYTEAIRLSPKYLLSWLNRGKAWQAKGDYEKAMADYDEAIRLDPRSPWGYALEASILATSPDAKYRDGAKAVKLATRAVELGGATDPYLRHVRAAAHVAAGEPDRAVEWQEKARAATPNAPAGDPAARRPQPQPQPNQVRTPIAQISGESFGANLAGNTIGSPSGVNVAANPDGALNRPDGSTRSFYGANYVLPATGASTGVLPPVGSTNLSYRSAVPTYYTGNAPNTSGAYPVRPVDPAYYGANYSGMSITTPGNTPGSDPANASARSFYGANYSGTTTFTPTPGGPSGYFPYNPTGTSFYGADYNRTMTFTPGTPPSGMTATPGITQATTPGVTP
jgi:tetratricopeptide (TPR) repeat protein